MSKRVLDVGNCVPDHAAIRRMLERHYGVEVKQTHAADDTLAALRSERFDLVLVNRKLDIDYSDGLDVIRLMKGDPHLTEIPVRLITNHPEYQQDAVQVGAELGFGKLELEAESTHERLAKFLG